MSTLNKGTDVMKLGILVFLVSLFTITQVYSVDLFSLVYKKDGTSGGDSLGYSVAKVGDIDGDGYDDFIIGAPGVSDRTGAVYLYSGADGDLIRQHTGPVSETLFGFAVDGGEDVNGDGDPDYVVGAPQTSLASGGAVYVYSGPTGNLIWRKDGNSEIEFQFGQAVSLIGDVTGNGKAEVLIGVYNTIFEVDTSAGAIYLYDGADTTTGYDNTYLFRKRGPRLGTSLAIGYSYVDAIGDINNDSKPDFIIGHYTTNLSRGTVYVHSGTDWDSGIDTTSLIFKLHGPNASSLFGFAVGEAGDVNGDGTPDFIVGAYENNSNGSAFVYSGTDASVIYQKNGEASGDRFGFAVYEAGDLNFDGKDDFLVGAPFADPGGVTNAGSAYCFSGATGSQIFKKNGGSANAWFGLSVHDGGNMNGGNPEVIIGSPKAKVGNIGKGSVYVYESILDYGQKVAAQLPTFDLGQNYPNPFNPSTSIAFSLAAESQVELEVFNILGEMVRTLVNETRAAGNYEVIFDGRDEKGKPLSSGTYFYRLTAGDKKVTKQMTLIK